jgi:hypothetical protein
MQTKRFVKYGRIGQALIDQTGDYIWLQSRQVEKSKFRPQRMFDEA